MKEVKSVTPLKEMIDYSEPLLYAGITKDSSLSKLFTVKPRLRKLNTLQLEKGWDMWNMNNLFMMYIEFSKKLIKIKHLYKPIELKKVIDYSKLGNIVEWEIHATKETIYIVLTGHYKEFTKITVLAIPSNLDNVKTPEIDLTSN
jgi:hypothetical protein